MTKNDAKLAVLIDADNISADIVEELFSEIAKYGIASSKRIYGDWSSEKLKKWQSQLLNYAITPVQQFAYTTGKNASDMCMAIEAMDLLYSNTFDGFCIVSSDSDFTPLVSRIRDQGLFVYGFGEKKTPQSLTKACDKFIYTEKLILKNNSTVEKKTAPPNKEKIQKIKGNSKLMNTIRDAIDQEGDDSGWAGLGGIGSHLNRVFSDFDVANYGFNKLSEFIKAIDLFETRLINSQLQVRKKQ